MVQNKKLNGKVAIVTGGGSGIGKATSILMAREGASVVVCNDKNIEAGKETVTMIKQENGEATFMKADVSSVYEVKELLLLEEMLMVFVYPS